MYVGAQRVRDDDGKISLTLYLYLHGGLLGPAEQGLLSDVRWISQRLPGQLAYQQHEGREGGRVVLSFLEVSGPDDSAPESLDPILALAARGIASGARRPVSTGAWGADFFAGPDVVATEEFENLREHLTTFIREHGTRPPSRALTILVTREPAGTAYTWDDESRERIRGAVAEWQPARLTITPEVREAFERDHGAFFPHALEILLPPDADIAPLGGVQFLDVPSMRVLWFSPEPAMG